MKFSCEKALLQSAIAVTSRAVAQKSSIPALEGLLLHADSQLTISGYNLQTGIRTTVSYTHLITPAAFWEIWGQAQERPDGFMGMFA